MNRHRLKTLINQNLCEEVGFFFSIDRDSRDFFFHNICVQVQSTSTPQLIWSVQLAGTIVPLCLGIYNYKAQCQFLF